MNALPGCCGIRSQNSPAVCTLLAGHPGPHQAQGHDQRVLDEWAPSIATPVATETSAA